MVTQKTINASELLNADQNTTKTEEKARVIGQDNSLPVVNVSHNSYSSYYEGHKDTLKTYKDWIYICSKLNAQSVAAVPLRLYSVTEEGQQSPKNFKTSPVSYYESKSQRIDTLRDIATVDLVYEHPALELLHEVSDISDYYTNMELTQTYLDICGNAYWYVAKEDDIPVSIHNLVPRCMVVIPDGKNGIAGYVYDTGNKKIYFEKDEIVRFSNPNPNGGYYGLSVVEAGSMSVTRYNLADRYEASRLANNGRPDFALTYTGGELTREQIRDYTREWNDHFKGADRAGKAKVLPADWEIKELGFSAQEMEYLEGRNVTKKEIALLFQIPYSMLDTTDSKKAGLDQTEKLYQKNAILPRVTRIEDVLNQQYLKMFDSEDLIFAYDDPVMEDKEFKLKHSESMLENGVITINEQRAQLGLEPVEWGDQPLSLQSCEGDQNEV